MLYTVSTLSAGCPAGSVMTVGTPNEVLSTVYCTLRTHEVKVRVLERHSAQVIHVLLGTSHHLTFQLRNHVVNRRS